MRLFASQVLRGHRGNGILPVVATLALLAAAVPGIGQAPAKDKAERPANRLARETSPYLLLHAHNPVDWYPWGPEAFAKAKKEGKLVFLSIGYSSCYWCHVMERESFENRQVAELLNRWFVCIKVDREERPDIDSTYMTALQVLGQNGGWPLSMFLTADGKPIVGGTYWPPEDRAVNGRTARGFKTVLQFVHDWNAGKPDEVNTQAGRLAEMTAAALAGRERGRALVELDRALVTGAVESLREQFDKLHGGFGSPERDFRSPKFPTPTYLELALYQAGRDKPGDIGDMARVTLDRMARGGIYDQLGGGFHRYSTERTWTVPHFEKMLYDNAQLVEVYSQAYARTNDPAYRRIVRETLAFIEREMTAPEGGFYSALDAETGGEEGRYYVWTDAEIDAALGNAADAAFLKQVYGADAGMNFEDKYHILSLPKPLTETARDMKRTEEQLEARLTPLRQKLLAARQSRPRPLLDTKILTGWNGQMIAGYALAGQALHEPRYVAAAARASDFVLQRLRTADGRLLRTYSARPGQPGEAKLSAYLEDYAFLVHGLLNLHDATGDARWIREARTLTDTMAKHFADPERGGFFFTSTDHEKLFARARDQFDSAQPSGNSVAARNLVRLWNKTGDTRYRDLAEKTFRAFAGTLKASPASLTTMAQALGMYLDVRTEEVRASTSFKQAPGGGAKRSDNVVEVKTKADLPDATGKQVITLTLTVESGWHLYANPVPKDFPGIPATVTVDAQPKPTEVKVDYPKGKPVQDAFVGDHQVYEGTVTIKATVRRAPGDTGPLEVSIKVQACNKDKCLLPATIKQTIR